MNEEQSVRYLTYQHIAEAGIPLIIIGYANLKFRIVNRKFLNFLIVGGIFFELFFKLLTGSRIDIFIGLLSVLIMVRFFNVSIPKKITTASILFIIIAILLISLLRLNPFTLGSKQFIFNLFNGKLFHNYFSYNGSSIVPILMQTDRVTIISFVIAKFQSGTQFLNGLTILAGPINYVIQIANRFLRIFNFETFNTYFWEGSSYINYWRFGIPNPPFSMGSNPPSLPGEFLYARRMDCFNYFFNIIFAFV